jgi:hypothetical protein
VLEGIYVTAREHRQPELARRALSDLVKLDEHDAKQAVALTRDLLVGGDVAQAVLVGQEAVMAGLLDGEAHRALAEALERAGNPKAAQFEQESAELCAGSDEEREAVLSWGLEFWRRQGVAAKFKRARRELEVLRLNRDESDD